MTAFLESIGFIEYHNGDADYKHWDQWQYISTYTRSEDLAWIEQSGINGVTGYDVCDFIRQWLIKEGHHGLSVCEVILTSDQFCHIRPYVGAFGQVARFNTCPDLIPSFRPSGLGNVFWSHLQKEGLLGLSGTFHQIIDACNTHSAQLRGPENFLWVDYFSLRQAQSGDFNVAAVVELVKVLLVLLLLLLLLLLLFFL
jgi:hypothetical protein